MNSPSSSPSPRFQFVDLLRGWAVFVMMETHVVNALIRVELKDTAFHKVLTFFNGLVAPTFLFCAGIALAITLRRKWGDYITFKPVMGKYVVRLLFILVVAYSLHLPFFSLSRLRAITDDSLWVSFFQVDILQTISVTLLILVALVVLTRKESVFIAGSVLTVIVIVFVSPIFREMDLSELPVWFGPYLTTQFKSQFPLFPWSAFLMMGTLVGYWYVKSREQGKEMSFVKRMAILAVAGIGLSLLAEFLPIGIYPHHDFWRASPEFFFVRLGLVVCCLIGLWWFERHRTVSSRSFLTLFGQESLLVYVVHLLIVYGHTYEWSLIRYFGPHLNYLECLGLLAGLSLAMYVLALIWHRMKHWNLKMAKVVQFAVLAGIVLTFLLKES